MDAFPFVDPIALPGPVWLFKVLHTVTLELHFFAVFLLFGGLVLATWWGLRGRLKNDPVRRDASGILSHRLPIVMAYVVNLGVPPLLFSQVLYGRALYTSSILIGIYWIAVILLLMATYFILYRMAYNSEHGRAHFVLGLVATLLVLKIAFIYSHNMTLMLRPEEWVEMYRDSPLGTSLERGNPLDTPRWLFMMTGAMVFSGIGLRLLARKTTLQPETRAFLDVRGKALLRVFVLVQLACAYLVWRSQPEATAAALADSAVYRTSAFAWLTGSMALFALGWIGGKNGAPAGWGVLGVTCAAAFLNVLALVVFRDGIRDVMLAQHGFDVWDRAVYANWVVIGLFLFMFVVMAASIGWMLSVVARAKGSDERYA